MNILKRILGLKEPSEDEWSPEGYKEWRAEMDAIRESRSVPAEGLLPEEEKQAEELAEHISPVYGKPFSKRRLPVTGGKLIEIDGIRDVPWQDEIHIDPISFHSEKEGKEVHYISMAADGPNADGSMHHGSLEYLPDYPDRETMLQSAADLAVLVYRITGHKPLILLTGKDRNQHAGWCMGQNKCPKGQDYDEFVGGYDD